MDPFSIAIGTVSLLDVCVRTASFLDEFRKAAPFAEAEIAALSRELAAIRTLNESLNAAFESELAAPGATGGEGAGKEQRAGKDYVRELWRNVGTAFAACEKHVTALEELVKHVTGADKVDASKPSAERGLTKQSLVIQWRRQRKSSHFDRLRQELALDRNTLQMLFGAIELYVCTLSCEVVSGLSSLLTSTVGSAHARRTLPAAAWPTRLGTLSP